MEANNQLTQMQCFETFDLATKGFTAKWYPGQDGKPIPKDALRICTEQGLKGIEKIRLDELRALPDFASVKHEIQVKAE